MSQEDWAGVVLRWFATTFPVVLVALLVVPFAIQGGTLVPWQPLMPELGTMVHVARQMIAGQQVFGPAASTVFGLTPFGALLVAPLALSTTLLWQLLLTVATVTALQHLLRRLFGLERGDLVLVGALAVLVVEPVRMTLAIGQVTVLLLLLVVVDLVEPVRGRRRRARLLPHGTLTGIAAGISLLPLWVCLGLVLAGRRRAGLTGLATAAGCLVVGWIVMPGQSEILLAGGRAGYEYGDATWVANQSFLAALARLGTPQALAAVLALLLALAATWAGARWYRSEPALGLGLLLLAAMLPQDPAWTWQFVGVTVFTAGLWAARRRIPRALGLAGWAWAGWVCLGVPQVLLSRLPAGVEMSVLQAVLADLGALLGVLVVVAGCASRAPGGRTKSAAAPRGRERTAHPA